MKTKYLILTFILMVLAFQGKTQAPDTLVAPKSHYILSVGTGWSHYISTMEVVSTKDVQKDFVGVTLLFLWDPGYRVSLGLETGFYRLFRIEKTSETGATGYIRTNVIPLFLVARMRIVDHFYLSIAPGLSAMTSKVGGIGEEITSTEWSLANFQGTATYLYPVSKKFSLGGEFQFILIGKTRDYLYSIQAVCAVKL